MTGDHLENMLAPLRVALRLEQEGKQFFSEAAVKVTGKAARQTFEFLAAEEDKHIRRIQDFYRSLEQSGGQDVPESEESDADARMAGFDDQMAALRHEIRPTLSDVDAYRMALKFENGAEEFYARQVKESADQRIQRFYIWLINEESMHARVLNSCIQFAEDPAVWFQKRK
jgi:rubrerythrin